MQILSSSPRALLASLIVVLLASPATFAQESHAQGKPERARTHVIHLTDGRVLRVQASPTADGWQIRQGRDWIELPADAVERVALEGDLKKESRKLDKAAGKDPVRRVAYADWLIQAGLHIEALQTLDRVLRKDPDQDAACELLARNHLPVALPPVQPLEPFLVAGAKGTPVIREIACARLVSEPEIPGLREALRAELTSSSPRRRSFATLALRRAMPGQEVQPLLRRAVLDASADVRVGASLALRDVNDPAVILPVLRALESRNDRVRKNAIESLAVMNYKAAVRPLYSHLVNLQSGSSGRVPHSHISVTRQMAYVQDFDVEVAQFSAIADPIINVLQEGVVLDAGVLGVHEYVVQTERASSRRALASLTGARPGNTTASWKRWWSEHGDEWTTGNSPSGPPSSPSSREN